MNSSGQLFSRMEVKVCFLSQITKCLNSVRLAAVPSPETAGVCVSQYLQIKTISGAYIMGRAPVFPHI